MVGYPPADTPRPRFRHYRLSSRRKCPRDWYLVRLERAPYTFPLRTTGKWRTRRHRSRRRRRNCPSCIARRSNTSAPALSWPHKSASDNRRPRRNQRRPCTSSCKPSRRRRRGCTRRYLGRHTCPSHCNCRRLSGSNHCTMTAHTRSPTDTFGRRPRHRKRRWCRTSWRPDPCIRCPRRYPQRNWNRSRPCRA